MKKLIILPMAFQVFYMFAFAVYMFRSRVQSIRSGQVSFKYFKMYSGDSHPDRLELIAQHYENQFEVPILFLITCSVFLALNVVSNATVFTAWIFILSRVLHAWIHLGSNHIRPRAAAFAVGWMALLVLWIQLLISVLV